MKSAALAALWFGSIATAALAQATLSKEEQAAISVPPERVFDRVEISGVLDPLDPVIWVSTQQFATKKFTDDKFFRSHIQKEDGSVFYQIYVQTRAPQSLRLNRMTYLVGGELKTAKADRVYFDVDCQRYGCSHYEDYVIELPREHLEALANEASAGVWRARLFGQTVQGIDLQLLANETVGFLMAVDRVRGTLAPKPQK